MACFAKGLGVDFEEGAGLDKDAESGRTLKDCTDALLKESKSKVGGFSMEPSASC